MAVILEVKNLKCHFRTERGLVKAVNGISYQISENEIVGLVGESGCGKSASQLSVMQLIPVPPGEMNGEVIFEGSNILNFKANGDAMRSIRGGKIGMVFQEPMTSLNPVLTIRSQLCDMIEEHLRLDRKAARARAIELLNMVGIPSAEDLIEVYPHQLSGGTRQRVMIAMALSCNPRLVIADEPTTAVDVTTQAQLLRVMKDMVTRFNASLLLVTHNLGVVARYAQRIFVMYAGRIVEAGRAKDIFGDPRHPYTMALLRSVPRLDEPRGRRLVPILGLPPSLINMADVCAFQPRCGYNATCRNNESPALRQVSDGHYVSCHLDVRRDY